MALAADLTRCNCALASSLSAPDVAFADLAEAARELVQRAGRDASVILKPGTLSAPGRPQQALFVYASNERVWPLGYVYGLGHEAGPLGRAIEQARAELYTGVAA